MICLVCGFEHLSVESTRRGVDYDTREVVCPECSARYKTKQQIVEFIDVSGSYLIEEASEILKEKTEKHIKNYHTTVGRRLRKLGKEHGSQSKLW